MSPRGAGNDHRQRPSFKRSCRRLQRCLFSMVVFCAAAAKQETQSCRFAAAAVVALPAAKLRGVAGSAAPAVRHWPQAALPPGRQAELPPRQAGSPIPAAGRHSDQRPAVPAGRGPRPRPANNDQRRNNNDQRRNNDDQRRNNDDQRNKTPPTSYPFDLFSFYAPCPFDFFAFYRRFQCIWCVYSYFQCIWFLWFPCPRPPSPECSFGTLNTNTERTPNEHRGGPKHCSGTT